jgi:hypothetical protein
VKGSPAASLERGSHQRLATSAGAAGRCWSLEANHFLEVARRIHRPDGPTNRGVLTELVAGLLLLTLLHQYGGLPLPVAACGGLLPTVPMGSLLEPASGFFEALVPVLPSLHPLGSSLLARELLPLATAQVRSCGPTRCSRVSKHARRMGLRTESLPRRSPNFRECLYTRGSQNSTSRPWGNKGRGPTGLRTETRRGTLR